MFVIIYTLKYYLKKKLMDGNTITGIYLLVNISFHKMYYYYYLFFALNLHSSLTCSPSIFFNTAVIQNLIFGIFKYNL